MHRLGTPDEVARIIYVLCTETSSYVNGAEIHIEMDGSLSLVRAHEISDAVEAKLRSAYPNVEIMIHQDPEGIEEPRSGFSRRVAAR